MRDRPPAGLPLPPPALEKAPEDSGPLLNFCSCGTARFRDEEAKQQKCSPADLTVTEESESESGASA